MILLSLGVSTPPFMYKLSSMQVKIKSIKYDKTAIVPPKNRFNVHTDPTIKPMHSEHVTRLYTVLFFLLIFSLTQCSSGLEVNSSVIPTIPTILIIKYMFIKYYLSPALYTSSAAFFILSGITSSKLTYLSKTARPPFCAHSSFSSPNLVYSSGLL